MDLGLRGGVVAAAVALLLGVGAAYVLIGALHDVFKDRAAARVLGAREALTSMLFDSEEMAERAFGELARLPRRPLLEAVRGLAVDIEGTARDRLRRFSRARGIARHVQRLARSRHWRTRVQAAQLQHLLLDDDRDVARLLADGHPLVKARTAEGLDGEGAYACAPQLLALLDDPTVAVHLAAQQALLRCNAEIVPFIVDFLEHGDVERPGVSAALEIAANFPDPRFVEPLRRYARSADPKKRELVAQGLGAMTGEPVEEILSGLLADEDDLVRATAAAAAGRTGSVHLTSALCHLLTDRSWAVRRQAGLALDRLGPSGALMLRLTLDHEDRYARDMARQILDIAEARRGADRAIGQVA